MEKEFLSHKGIPFVDKNVREDPAAREELQRLGYRATPVTVIDGEVVVGFDRGKIERLLGLSGHLTG
jgi:glutaredoxin